MIPSVVNFFKRILEELSPSRLLLSTPYVSFSQDHILGMFSSQESLFLISYLEFEEIYACERLRSSDSRQASCLDDDSLTVISLFSLCVSLLSVAANNQSLPVQVCPTMNIMLVSLRHGKFLCFCSRVLWVCMTQRHETQRSTQR